MNNLKFKAPRRKLFKDWIAALRSGKFKQGKGGLKLGNKFCCLGVLCEVAGAEFFNNSYVYKKQPINNFTSPDVVMEAAGIPANLANRLMSLNDAEGEGDRPHTFKQIADKLEAHDLS